MSEEILERYNRTRNTLKEMTKIMRCSPEQLLERVSKLIEDTENLKNEREELLRKLGCYEM